jgi:hypothetical protein
MMRRLPALALLAGLWACNAGKIRVEPVPAPAASRDPVTDALGALSKGDRRFLVVGGTWVWRVPGIPRACSAQVHGRKQVRYIQFIGDVIQQPRNAADAARRDSMWAEAAAAEQYAARYNAVIADGTGFRCVGPPGPLEPQALFAAIHHALLAQVAGPGGCLELDHLEPTDIAFFPDVRFWVGTCLLEHGTTAHSLAGSDVAGQVYLLDSESGFSFLISQHPPVGLDSGGAIRYARLALIMQGKLPWNSRLAMSGTDLPARLCRLRGGTCGTLSPSRATNGGRVVYLTAFTDEDLFSAGPLSVNLQTGAVVGPAPDLDNHASHP